ncbi:hypothetical protein THII_2246 [Thioploca ingrica]|uniref:Toprim domain-containing protein n=1 Tax=Thioploca ingrica TaxID=40754 RepID=A0A090AEU0_9GAMM|nr:hypothetical protein THII_2246 [Thioploca ingrica]
MCLREVSYNHFVTPLLYLDPNLNGGLKTQCHGEKKGYFWTADYYALKSAHTAVIVESSINALTVDTAELPGYVGISTLGIENATEINWEFLRGKRVVICMDKDGPKGNGLLPGQEKLWELYNNLCDLGISTFLINQENWKKHVDCQTIISFLDKNPDRETWLLDDGDNQSFLHSNEKLEQLKSRLASYDIDLNDLANQSVATLKKALQSLDTCLIPGVLAKSRWKSKTRVWLPEIDTEDYWRFIAQAEHTLFIKTVTKTVESMDGFKEKIDEEIPNHVAGFRIANLTKIIVAGYVATLKGVHDDSPTTFYAVQVQTRRNGNNLVKKVFSDGLFNPKKWEDLFGPIYDQHNFKRALNIMENVANANHRHAVNFVGLAWFNGRLQVNPGDACYFPEPEQQCPYFTQHLSV